MKLLIENWRKLLEEEWEVEGLPKDVYTPAVAQPAEESEESTIELLNQLDELVKKIKDSIGAPPEETGMTEPHAAGAVRSKRVGPTTGPGADDAPFEE